MILLYTLLVVLVGLVHFLVARRAKALEKKFSRVSLATAKLATLGPRAGNSRADLCVSARQQFELGRLVVQRDRLERKYFRWQHAGERLSRLVARLRQWKGKKLPYTMGVLDVSTALYFVDRYGLGHVDLSAIVQALSTLF